MPVITLKDGTQGYQYPPRPKAYQPTKTPYVGLAITQNNRTGGQDIIIREAAGNIRPDARGGGCYWVAPVLPTGDLGPMTTRYVYAEEIAARS
jgi:hypothetical protein